MHKIWEDVSIGRERAEDIFGFSQHIQAVTSAYIRLA